jgi:hypothetical protein
LNQQDWSLIYGRWESIMANPELYNECKTKSKRAATFK